MEFFGICVWTKCSTIICYCLCRRFFLVKKVLSPSVIQECSICFTTIQTNDKYQLDCNHFYHKLCIKKWEKRRNTCPLCRKIFYLYSGNRKTKTKTIDEMYPLSTGLIQVFTMTNFILITFT